MWHETEGEAAKKASEDSGLIEEVLGEMRDVSIPWFSSAYSFTSMGWQKKLKCANKYLRSHVLVDWLLIFIYLLG